MFLIAVVAQLVVQQGQLCRFEARTSTIGDRPAFILTLKNVSGREIEVCPPALESGLVHVESDSVRLRSSPRTAREPSMVTLKAGEQTWGRVALDDVVDVTGSPNGSHLLQFVYDDSRWTSVAGQQHASVGVLRARAFKIGIEQGRLASLEATESPPYPCKFEALPARLKDGTWGLRLALTNVSDRPVVVCPPAATGWVIRIRSKTIALRRTGALSDAGEADLLSGATSATEVPLERVMDLKRTGDGLHEFTVEYDDWDWDESERAQHTKIGLLRSRSFGMLVNMGRVVSLSLK